ncbi:growth/differentiation factor 8-like [Menidia menidia]
MDCTTRPAGGGAVGARAADRGLGLSSEPLWAPDSPPQASWTPPAPPQVDRTNVQGRERRPPGPNFPPADSGRPAKPSSAHACGFAACNWIRALRLCCHLPVGMMLLVLWLAACLPPGFVALGPDGGEPCAACGGREHSRLLRLHSIRSRILSLLRLEQAPNISRDLIRQLLPRAPLTQLLDRHDPRPEDPEHAAQTIITMATKPPPAGPDRPPACCLFRLSSGIQPQTVLSARLWLNLRPAAAPGPVSLQAWRPRGGRGGAQRVEAEAGAGSWQSLDVKPLLQAWLRAPEGSYGLQVHAFDAAGKDLAVTSARPGEEGLQPFIEVKVLDGSRRSRRDSGLNCEEESAETRCCRYPLTVDFEEFGWDWIIAPKRYRANYCSGECEFTHLQQYPHAHLVNKANPRGSAGPCCTPSKMSPINMLYLNRNEQIIYEKIPSMVVDNCGCS